MSSIPSRSLVGFTLGVALLLTAPGCGSGAECGPGTRLDDGTCSPVCEPGTEQDPATGTCVPVCAQGTHRDTATGACVLDSTRCVTGQVWDPAGAACVDAADYCAPGTVWLASAQACVSDDALRSADQYEGEGFNDYVPQAACEPLELPSEGQTWTVGGTISEAIFEMGFLFTDNDCWAFTVAEPTLLRIRADGTGGAAAAFQIVSLDDYTFSHRLAIGSTGDDVARDVYLGGAGTYAIVVTDAAHFLGSGPVWRGGELGYLVDVTPLPIPAPEPLELEDGLAAASGIRTAEPPADGTQIAFYSLPVEDDSLWSIDVGVSAPGVEPAVTINRPDGTLSNGTIRSGYFPQAFATGGQVLLAVDLLGAFDLGALEYTLSVERLEMPILDDELPETTFQQQGWSVTAPPPAVYFGFEAAAGEVVTLLLESSTGQTCFTAMDERFGTYADDNGCGVGFEPIHDVELRFEAPYTGLFTLQFIDTAGGTGFGRKIHAVPSHSYTVGGRIVRQQPTDLGDVPVPWTSTETVTAEAYERFFAWNPQPGDALRVDAVGHGAFAPWAGFRTRRRPDDPTYNLWFWDWMAPDARFAFRSVDGQPLLFSVLDETFGAGQFDLSITRFTPADLGTVRPGAPIHTLEDIEAGDVRRYFQLGLDAPALVELVVSPTSLELDAALALLQENLLPDGGLIASMAEAGNPESLVHTLPAGPFALEAYVEGRLPLGLPETVEVRAEILESYPAEQEPDDTHEAAQEIAFPGVVVGAADGLDDVDWYRFATTGAETVDVVLSAAGTGSSGAALRVFGSDGQAIGVPQGPDDFQTLEGLFLPGAGTWYVAVWPDRAPNHYRLEVRRGG